MTLHVLVNGTPAEVAPGATLSDLAAQFGLAVKAVLVECNGEALLRSEWPARPVAEGDRIEFIRMVAGG
ncbi:sulfur carrier protein [Verrucomicrobium sp. GAS474]|uniref:sulfur carrier protein ThiS n=1 Tax=Verrucomicrobium sp. GAS474 TaxID=1882831 RepID=UPI0008792F96|nr:sulfur carrier protein ThiS [Verrucomicrobium sp. GAS474]SDU06936.1 sulfur carrier protein [Verrucomicrobium sp. GAS474]